MDGQWTSRASWHTSAQSPRPPPSDSALFLDDPDAVDPSLFVRASTSIPSFLEPLRVHNAPPNDAARLKWRDEIDVKILSTCLMVDGGVMSNVPIADFHVHDQMPSAPTFGVKLGVETRNRTDTPTAFALANFNSARHNLDRDFIRSNPDYSKLVATIDTGDHNWLNFRLTDDEKLDLFRRGARAAAAFIAGFKWDEYKKIREELIRAQSHA